MKRLLIILLAIVLWPACVGAAGKTMTVDGVASVATINGSTFDIINGVAGTATTPTISFSTAVDKATYNPGSSIATTSGVDVDVGDLLVITLYYRTASTVSVSDSATTPNTFTVLDANGDTAKSGITRIAYSVITTSKSADIITASFDTSQSDNHFVTLTVGKFTKSSGTWYTDGAQVSSDAYGTTVASATGNTTYAAGLSIGLGSSSSGVTWSNTNLYNLAGTVFPASPVRTEMVQFYRTHAEITGNHSDVTVSSNSWIHTRYVSFGAQ